MDKFDLLVRYDDNRYKRVPFTFYQVLDKDAVIGLFPFKGDNRYIALDEGPECTYKDAKRQLNKHRSNKPQLNENLLDVSFCIVVYPIIKEVNERLAALKKPQLSGEYLADNEKNMPDQGWVVKFDSNHDTLPADYYGRNVAAKVRYIGVAPEENRGLF